MTKRKTAITVTISKTRHATQSYTVTIDKPGKAEPYQLKQRYSRKDAAMRGGLRSLKAYGLMINACGDKVVIPFEAIPAGRIEAYYTPDKLPIQFVFNKK